MVTGVLYDIYGKTLPFLLLAASGAIVGVGWYASYFMNLLDNHEDASEPLLAKTKLQEKEDEITYWHLLTHVTPALILLVTLLERLSFSSITPLVSNRLHEVQEGVTQGCVKKDIKYYFSAWSAFCNLAGCLVVSSACGCWQDGNDTIRILTSAESTHATLPTQFQP